MDFTNLIHPRVGLPQIDKQKHKKRLEYAGGAVQIAVAPSVVAPRPPWHAPWVLARVISGHTGWVRGVAVDPSNEWFVTGGADRLLKIWDLASGELKLTLTGHVSGIRSVAISTSRPYLFSAGEDKTVKCWDLEMNKVVRHYHGHLSGVYSMAIHPALDIIATGARDSVVRLWDIRTKAAIHVLTGHDSAIASLAMQENEFQLISGSLDSTIKLWDIRMGKSRKTLTHHKKSVRSIVLHPKEAAFASGSADNIKQWEERFLNDEFPEIQFVQNFAGQTDIVNAMAVNHDNVLVSGGNGGTLCFWDWNSGHRFQDVVSPLQPGTLEAEAGIFAMTFDQTGSRLITCEGDKSIKIWKEDENATMESHPVNWKPELRKYH